MTPAETLKREAAKAKRESLEALLAQHLRAEGIEVVRELQFYPPRMWRFDFAIMSGRLAIEVAGGTWSGGRHVTGKGYAADCEKAAHAAMAGWRYMPVTGEQIKSGAAIGWIKAAMRLT